MRNKGGPVGKRTGEKRGGGEVGKKEVNGTRRGGLERWREGGGGREGFTPGGGGEGKLTEAEPDGGKVLQRGVGGARGGGFEGEEEVGKVGGGAFDGESREEGVVKRRGEGWGRSSKEVGDGG